MPGPTEEQIRLRAYEIWVAEGRPHGRDHDHWLAARAELEFTVEPKPKKARAVKTEAVADAERVAKKPAKAKPAPKAEAKAKPAAKTEPAKTEAAATEAKPAAKAKPDAKAPKTTAAKPATKAKADAKAKPAAKAPATPASPPLPVEAETPAPPTKTGG